MTMIDHDGSRRNKLTGALASVIGKTISDIVILTNPPGRVHLFLVFADGTHYEFYDMSDLNGARGIDRGGVEQIAARVASGGTCLVIPAKASDGAGQASDVRP
jgi:hypothetical protein